MCRDEIVRVPAVPHTLTGKRLEVPVKKILLGTATVSAVDKGSVDRPELLSLYAELSAERRARSGPAPGAAPGDNGRR